MMNGRPLNVYEDDGYYTTRGVLDATATISEQDALLGGNHHHPCASYYVINFKRNDTNIIAN